MGANPVVSVVRFTTELCIEQPTNAVEIKTLTKYFIEF
ncbi:hypothetical protein AOR13_479 [Alteromonas stellipolaris LMG 21856]|nr:hypothetical protein AOR13_479 [Alteromonas stellipolaris LMG 21856]